MKIFLAAFLLFSACFVYGQDIIGTWKTWIEIDDNPLGSLSAWWEQPPVEQITFAEETGTVKFRGGKERHFAWENSTEFLTVSYLTKKQEFWVADSESLLMRYTLIDENTLLVHWQFQDDYSTYYLILRRLR